MSDENPHPAPEFKSWRSYDEFARSVRDTSRFVREPEQEEFLETVVATAKATTIPAGGQLWRAQLGGEEDDSCQPRPYSIERMTPAAEFVGDGRANPKRIPCLYVATQWKIALAEMRPWLESWISLAVLRPVRELKVVNCGLASPGLSFHFVEPSAAERQVAVWRAIDHAFSRPVTRDEPALDYLPTQIIAEKIRSAGFDGIAYRSALGKGEDKGHNIAFFDPSAASIEQIFLVELEEIDFKFKDVYGTFEPLPPFGSMSARIRRDVLSDGF